SPFEVGPDEVGIGKVGTIQVGALQVGAAQVGSGEIGALQIGVTQVAVVQIGPGEIGPLKVAARKGRVAAEVRDGLPQHWTKAEVSGETRSDDLAAGVHCRGVAVATEGAENDHPACRRPGEGWSRRSAEGSNPDD